MEVHVLNSKTGQVLRTQRWPTIKRKWLNERWDTQARMFAVSGGFLVHAGNSLERYSAERLETKIALPDDKSCSVTIPPGGKTVHLQIVYDDNKAKGEWLTVDELRRLSGQWELAGATSASSDAVVYKLAHCVQMQKIGDSSRNLYCAEPSHLGLPLFVSDSEVLSVYSNGFAIFSTDGKRLWSREAMDNHTIADHKRSLDGNRFGILVRGHTVFDGVEISNREWAILLYDRVKQTQVFHLKSGRRRNDDQSAAFDLSPDGTTMAVLAGDNLQFYKVTE
jgi:hypothetical protein